jgi:hypothetical protein
MKNKISTIAFFLLFIISIPAFSQAEKETLGLPGDNLDLYAVLDLFQKSKTIEDFEKSLNDTKSGINNLDLNLDKKVDFIKVETKQKEDDFTFILQIAVSEKEIQDVAVILVSKDKNKKVTMQIVGDKELYGKDYIVEPKTATATANPGYTNSTTTTVATTTTAPTTVVVVESAPIVQYVYSPVYVPYYPPYYYAYYPPYYSAVAVISVGIYHSNHYYRPYHGGGYGNTTVVVNHNTYNNYNNNSRNTSNTVNHYNTNGNYNSNNKTTNTRNNTNTSNSVNSNNRTSTSNTTRTSPTQTNTNRTSTSQTSSNRTSSSANNHSSLNRSSRSGGRRR